jgi:hypothetical protein
MSRIRRPLIHNWLVALSVGLPLLIATAMVAARLTRPEWGVSSPTTIGPASHVVIAFAFWYVILIVPTLVFAGIHSALAATVVRLWPRVDTRAVFLATGVAMALFAAVGLTMWTRESNGAGILLAFLISSIVYGFIARPLQPTPRS